MTTAALWITSTAPSERRLTGRLLFLLAGLAALGSLATNIILPAFPHIGTSISASSQELGLTLSSFFVAFGFGQLLAGPLSDRFGRKWLVLGGLAVFAAGSVLCAFADTLSFLVLGRVIQALGACAASVLSRAIARDLFDGQALARALALTMIAGAAAPGFSPLLGSVFDSLVWLADHIPRRSGVWGGARAALFDECRRNSSGRPQGLPGSFGRGIRLWPPGR
jgi:MFS transporter, DHA1 family, multidrug resistance protein